MSRTLCDAVFGRSVVLFGDGRSGIDARERGPTRRFVQRAKELALTTRRREHVRVEGGPSV